MCFFLLLVVTGDVDKERQLAYYFRQRNGLFAGQEIQGKLNYVI